MINEYTYFFNKLIQPYLMLLHFALVTKFTFLFGCYVSSKWHMKPLQPHMHRYYVLKTYFDFFIRIFVWFGKVPSE